MILDVYDLGHVFHLVANPLTCWMIPKMYSPATRSEAANPLREILVLRSLTVPLNSI